MKTAIVHDWFAGYAGSERVVESLTNIWKDADVFVLFNLLTPEEQKIVTKNKVPITSFLQNRKSIKTKHRNYLPLFPYAIEQFDLSGYDLVISSSHAVAKGVLTNSNQLHINYCHTPVRYAWDLTHQYLREANLTKGLKGMIAKAVLHYIRLWDVAASNRVDEFIANSNYIAARIKKTYRRESTVIYPPVDVEKFKFGAAKENYYLTASRFVPYKRIDLIIEAFSKMPDKKLVIIGEGPDEVKLKSISSKNIEFAGYQTASKLNDYMQRAKAFVFAADEDFGIMPVEALASGTPVIALNKGGTAETIIDNKTGILFDRQDSESIKNAVLRFEKFTGGFDPGFLNSYAKQFDRKIFEEKIYNFINAKEKEFFKG